MLWLAPQLTIGPNAASDEKEICHEEEATPVVSDAPAVTDATTKADSSHASPSHEKPELPALYAAGDSSGGGAAARRIQLRGAPALPDALAIGRALRPLSRRRSGSRVELDERATAEFIAETGLRTAVWRPAVERWFDIVVAVEDVPSLAAWQPTVSEFERLLRHQGGFRNVRTISLCHVDGHVKAIASNGCEIPKRGLQDRNERQILLVVSDCTSSAWRSGAMGAWLQIVSERSPLAVVQLLPQALWPNTATGFAELRVQSPRVGAPVGQLRVRMPSWAVGEPGVVVPALALEPNAVANWARMASSTGGAWGTAALFPLPDDDVDQNDAPSPSQRAVAFRASATPDAQLLATYFSAVRPLTPPVMRVIHRAMAPASGPVALAQIFLGGLLQPVANTAPERRADEVVYDFYPGLRDHLVAGLSRRDFIEVNLALHDYLQQETGTPFDFFALIEDSNGDVRLPVTALPFAESARALARRFVKPSEATIWTAPRSDVGTVSLEVIASAQIEDTRSLPSIFVSSAASDNQPGIDTEGGWVSDMVRLLRSSAQVFHPDDIRPGEDFNRTIDQALQRCDWFLIVMSEAYLSSTYCQEEIKRFVNLNLAGAPERNIVVVEIEPVDRSQWPLPLRGLPSIKFWLPERGKHPRRFERLASRGQFYSNIFYERKFSELLRALKLEPLDQLTADKGPMNWVLVAGTGLKTKLSQKLAKTCDALGTVLARSGYGLINGGWPGVDEAVARSFIGELERTNTSAQPDKWLIHVIARGNTPTFSPGQIVQVPTGEEEYVESINRASFVVLIGGAGGAMEIAERAHSAGKVVLPLANTGGDASTYHQRMKSMRLDLASNSEWSSGAPIGIDSFELAILAMEVPRVVEQLPKILDGLLERAGRGLQIGGAKIATWHVIVEGPVDESAYRILFDRIFEASNVSIRLWSAGGLAVMTNMIRRVYPSDRGNIVAIVDADVPTEIAHELQQQLDVAENLIKVHPNTEEWLESACSVEYVNAVPPTSIREKAARRWARNADIDLLLRMNVDFSSLVMRIRNSISGSF